MKLASRMQGWSVTMNKAANVGAKVMPLPGETYLVAERQHAVLNKYK